MNIKRFLLGIGLVLVLGVWLMCALFLPSTTVLASHLPPIPEILPKGVVVKDIAMAAFNPCILLSNGKVQCWGRIPVGVSKTGELQFPEYIQFTPITVHEIEAATDIAVGTEHFCAIEGGTVQCWGSNSMGQLGNGTKVSSITPVTVLGITTAKAVAAGGDNTCVLLMDGMVKCWGARAGKDVDLTNPDSLVPVAVPEITDALSIVVGLDDGCALLSNNTVKCWRNIIGKHDGFLDGKWSKDKSERWSQESKPIIITGITSVKGLFSIYDYFCASLKIGRTKCWHGDEDPVMVEEISSVKAIAGGYRHTCALLPNGTVKCWTEQFSPKIVSGVASAVDIIADRSDLTCVVMSKGRTVKCWMIQEIDAPTTIVGGP